MDIRDQTDSGLDHLLLWIGYSGGTDNASKIAGGQLLAELSFILRQIVQGPNPRKTRQ